MPTRCRVLPPRFSFLPRDRPSSIILTVWFWQLQLVQQRMFVGLRSRRCPATREPESHKSMMGGYVLGPGGGYRTTQALCLGSNRKDIGSQRTGRELWTTTFGISREASSVHVSFLRPQQYLPRESPRPCARHVTPCGPVARPDPLTRHHEASRRARAYVDILTDRCATSLLPPHWRSAERGLDFDRLESWALRTYRRLCA